VADFIQTMFMARKPLPLSSRSSMFGHRAISCGDRQPLNQARVLFPIVNDEAVTLMHRSTISCSFSDRLLIPMLAESISPN